MVALSSRVRQLAQIGRGRCERHYRAQTSRPYDHEVPRRLRSLGMARSFDKPGIMDLVSTLTNYYMPPTNTNEFGLLLFGTARAWRTKLDQRLRPLGLSQGKWRTLIHLSQGGNKLTQKEIAERMGIEEPTLAGLLDRLQEDGWIKRRESPSDRRCKIVHLQRRSKAVLDEIFNAAHGLRHELIDDVPPSDLDACIRVLTQIRKKAEGPAAAARNRRAASGRRNVASRN